jgi:hypothetical protein
VILDGFDHNGVLEFWFGYLHAPGATNAGVRHIAVAGYFIGGVHNYNSFLEVIGQDPGGFAQQSSLANSRTSHQQDALARFYEVANYVDGSVDGAPHPTGKPDDFADAISYRRDPVKRPFDSGAIVPGESTHAASHVLNIFTGNQGIGQIDSGAGISRLWLAAQVENSFD